MKVLMSPLHVATYELEGRVLAKSLGICLDQLMLVENVQLHDSQ